MNTVKSLIVLICALALAAPAMAKPDPLKALKKQVAQLQVQVQQLQVQSEHNRQLAVCYYVLGQDSFRIAFFALSRLTLGIAGQNVPAWEQIQKLDDQGSCQAVGIARP